jgi:hypothetical protein
MKTEEHSIFVKRTSYGRPMIANYFRFLIADCGKQTEGCRLPLVPLLQQNRHRNKWMDIGRTGRHAGRLAGWLARTGTGTDTDRGTGTATDRPTDQRDMQPGMQTGRHDRQTGCQAGRQTSRQADGKTERPREYRIGNNLHYLKNLSLRRRSDAN